MCDDSNGLLQRLKSFVFVFPHPFWHPFGSLSVRNRRLSPRYHLVTIHGSCDSEFASIPNTRLSFASLTRAPAESISTPRRRSGCPSDQRPSASSQSAPWPRFSLGVTPAPSNPYKPRRRSLIQRHPSGIPTRKSHCKPAPRRARGGRVLCRVHARARAHHGLSRATVRAMVRALKNFFLQSLAARWSFDFMKIKALLPQQHENQSFGLPSETRSEACSTVHL